MTTALSGSRIDEIAAGEPAWLADQRRAAWEVFSKLPYPTARDEQWRRFNLRPLNVDKIGVEPGGEPPVTTKLTALPAETIAQGVVFCELSAAIQKHPDLVRAHLGKGIPPDEPRKFAALHTALWRSGAFLYVPRGVKIAGPLEVSYQLHGSGVAGFPHTLIVVEEGAEATFVERFAGGPAPSTGANGSASLNAGATEVFVKDNARLHYVSLQNFSAGVFDFTLKRAHVGRDAEIDWVLGMFGGSFMRCDVECSMDGPGGMSYMYGVGVGDGRQQFGQFTNQHHRCGKTVSDLLFKNVYQDQAVGVYSGVIHVERNANGTNAYQANRNLVLSDKVKCDTRPLLEIESNDLRCTHGATVGRLDEDQLFYLRSRGLTPSQARQMLIEAFLEPVLARIRMEDVQQEFHDLIHHKVVGKL